MKSYTLKRKDGGYFIVEVTFDKKVIEKQITEPDVLPITLAKLNSILRKDLGL